MVRVIAKNFLKAENIEVAAPLFREMIAETVKEDGCIEYRLFVDNSDPTIHIFTEEWTTQEALDKHAASAHYARIIPQIRALCAKPGELSLSKEFK